LTGVILAIHSALAALTRIPEIALEEDEAKKLSVASKEVLKFYPLGMSDKVLAWVNLGVVGCGIYGTRIMAYSVRRGAEQRAKVVTLPGGGSKGPGPAAQGPQSGKVNGHAMSLDDLTPAWMAVAPENEVIP
jgi:hypothetical protein